MSPVCQSSALKRRALETKDVFSVQRGEAVTVSVSS